MLSCYLVFIKYDAQYINTVTKKDIPIIPRDAKNPITVDIAIVNPINNTPKIT